MLSSSDDKVKTGSASCFAPPRLLKTCLTTLVSYAVVVISCAALAAATLPVFPFRTYLLATSLTPVVFWTVYYTYFTLYRLGSLIPPLLTMFIPPLLGIILLLLYTHLTELVTAVSTFMTLVLSSAEVLTSVINLFPKEKISLATLSQLSAIPMMAWLNRAATLLYHAGVVIALINSFRLVSNSLRTRTLSTGT